MEEKEVEAMDVPDNKENTQWLRQGSLCSGSGKTISLRITINSVSAYASSGDWEASLKALTKDGRGSVGIAASGATLWS